MTANRCAAIHSAAFAGMQRGWSAAEITQILAQSTTVFCGTDAGFALARSVLDEAELLTIAVAPGTQRRGVGRALLEALETRSAARGALRMFLEVAVDNAPAQALYARAGYRPCGTRRGYYARAGGVRVDAVLLEKRLCPSSQG